MLEASIGWMSSADKAKRHRTFLESEIDEKCASIRYLV
jgi:hypothetical protein